MTNSFNCSKNNFNSPKETHISTKGSRFSIAAFLLLIAAFLTAGCESPGAVGDDIISEGESVESQSIPIQDYTVLEDNSFSGRLANTAVGQAEDPLYGTMKAIALLKPSISQTEIDTIREQDTISLRLIFSSPVYGDSLATSTYEIFEAGEIWRGTELRFNNEVPVNMSSKVGEFQVTANEDTVVVDLDQAWTLKFAEFFNSDTALTSAQRDSIYINNFPGLAIVPSEGNKNIRFLKTWVTEDEEEEEELITSFLYNSSVQDDDDDDEGPEIISVRDWGISFTRTMAPDTGEGILLHNSERVLKLQLDVPAEELSSKNIVNAKLIFSKDDSPQQNEPQFTRPNTNFIRAHVFDEEPADVMGEIFTTEHSFATSLNDTSNAFLLNITQHVINEVYGDQKNRILYITIESIDGVFYSSHFFDPNSADIKKPRLVITYVEE